MDKEKEGIVSAFKQFDELTDIQEPSLSAITEKIKLHQEQKKASFLKELILFICVACSLFIGTFLLAFEAPISVVIIQGLGFIAFPIIFKRDKKKIESEWI
ncbi:YxlC family protein [Gottfriedia luciferensis]|uniref:YxlC family protein n=1 Tax=Gottfriedia luciferensis TaxID=178774 RepID=UPI000B446951|nr:YxlC family protein [Gottfriedia luciferensis]